MLNAVPTDIPRVALVTGGAQRLGRTIAVELARNGFDVAIHCHTSIGEATQTVADVRALGRRGVVVQADLAVEADVEALIAQATAALGPLGVLVNNASRFDRDEWRDVTRNSWDAHMEPNLRAPFVLI